MSNDLDPKKSPDQPSPKEDKNNENKGGLDINTLSSIIGGEEVDIDETPDTKEFVDDGKVVMDINLENIEHLSILILKQEYDFVIIEPYETHAKLSFKKDSLLKDVKYIPLRVYMDILLKAKASAKLDVTETNKEQKGKGSIIIKEREFETVVKVDPGNLGETLFLKVRHFVLDDKTKAKKKKSLSMKQAFGFLGALLVVTLILGVTFISFVVFNAKDPQDVDFFTSLGINLNDINNFLLQATTFLFSVFLLITTIIFSIFLFRALLTKKEFKKKRLFGFILAGFFLVVMIATATFWMYLDGKIKSLPNWEERSRGSIQVLDNNLFTYYNGDKNSSTITDTSKIIGPITIQFDVNNLVAQEKSTGFSVETFEWDFGDGRKHTTQNPTIIHEFNKKGTSNISLKLIGTDKRIPGQKTEKIVSNTPTITIDYLVNITSTTLTNGSTQVTFDASDLKDLGTLEWFLSSNSKEGVPGYIYSPSKVFVEKEQVGLKISTSQKSGFDRVFTVEGEVSDISGDIQYDISLDNDRNYTFRVENIQNGAGDGFIEKFEWEIEGKTYTTLTKDINNPEASSKQSHTFKDFGDHVIRVTLTNTNGKTQTLIETIHTSARINLNGNISMKVDGKDLSLKDTNYRTDTQSYSLYDVEVPAIVTFDATRIQSSEPLYAIEDISWEIAGNPNSKVTNKKFEYNFQTSTPQTINVTYTLVHRNNPQDIITLKQQIFLNFITKEVRLNLVVSASQEYAPAIVQFDASKSRVEGDDIVKFIYDYGDGDIEERDAQNHGRLYDKPGEYTIKLTVITASGKNFTHTETLILKAEPDRAKITASMYSAPVNQGINFDASQTTGYIDRVKWDFGDGNTSTETSPSHAYTQPGTYSVKLEVILINKNVLFDSMNITITQ